MTVFDRIEQLRKTQNLSQGKLEKELGFSNGSISKWRNSTPTYERLQKVADYFGVSVEYLMTGEAPEEKKDVTLTRRDERDIKKDLDPEAAELFRDELEIALRRLKIINKEKYTPKKYKK